MISENQDGKTEPASQATGWDSGLGHPFCLDRCPSLAGAGESGRRPGEGREEYPFFCGKDRGEVSNSGNHKTMARRGHELLHQASLFAVLETQNIIAGEANITLIPSNSELLGAMIVGTQATKAVPTK
jgi:hypothetical protein